MYADIRYRPPKWMCAAVDDGELPIDVLLVWKATVERLEGKFNYGAGVKVWRNKCRKEGVDMGRFAASGRYSPGSWRRMTGDKIEAWVREQLKSQEPAPPTNAWDRLDDPIV